MKHICLTCLICCLPMMIHTQEDRWEAALSAFQVQNYQKALIQLQQMPESVPVLEKKAFCLYQLGQWTSAKEVYGLILEQDSLHLQSHLYLGTIYDQEYDFPKSIRHFRQLVHLDSSNTQYLKALARVYEKAGLVKDAYPLYEKVRKLNPQDISTLLSQSGIWLDRKEFAIADSLANLALELDTANLQVILIKARCAYSLKDYGQVVVFFEKTRGRIDLNPFYQKMLGFSYLQIDSLDRAIHVLTNLLYQEQSEFTYSYLARAHAEKEDWDLAMKFYEQAIAAGLSKNLEQYHLALAKLNQEHGQLSAVIEHFDEAFHYSANPEYIFFKAQAAEIYYKDKQVALDQYRRYIRLSGASQDQYRDFANDRIRLLKEYLHQVK